MSTKKNYIMWAIFITFIITAQLHAMDFRPRVVFPKPDKVIIRDCDRWDLLVVKFIEGSFIRLRDNTLVTDKNIDLSGLQTVIRDYPNVRIARLFSRPEPVLWQEKMEGEVRIKCELADLNLYYAFGTSSRSEAQTLANKLNTLDIVETVYPEVKPELAGFFEQRVPTPNFQSDQGYLGPSPVGVDAYSSWLYAAQGSKGENVKFIDVELGWTWTHEDLIPAFFTAGTPSTSTTYTQHGTAVLGEVRGTENGFGITGIAPLVQIGGVAIDIDDYPDNLSDWFNIASSNLDPGDVWLIELHAPGPGGAYIPMEWWQGNFDAIAASTALGRICVQAGGNGSADLDNAIYEGKFDRNVRDSLAILVGAGLPQSMLPESFTNYGSRMDANGWGSEIVTTGYGYLWGSTLDDYYTDSFGGTSGASPMVVGVAVAAQSRYKAMHNGSVLDPATLRTIIKETGVEPPNLTQYIGPRPNLAALMQHPIFTAPVPSISYYGMILLIVFLSMVVVRQLR